MQSNKVAQALLPVWVLQSRVHLDRTSSLQNHTGKSACATLFHILCDHRSLFAEAGGLFEGVSYLQHRKIFLVAANDLHADRKPFRRKSSWN